MSWILLAFLGGVFSNISSFFSRFILKEKDSDSTLYAWFFEGARAVVFSIVAFTNFRIIVSWYSVLLFLVLGASEFISMFFYMRMHKYSHLSISTILSRTRLIWIPIIAFLIAGEHLMPLTYLGIAVLFIGLAVASAPHKLGKDKGQLYAYISAFFIAINVVVFKMAQPFASDPLLIVFLTLPITLFYPVIISKRKKRIYTFFSYGILPKVGAGVASVVSIYFFARALDGGPATIVNGIYQATLVLSVMAGIFILGEKEDMSRKIAGSVITLIGVLLLS
jgi:drug/metabolite transporter (DMT)-like permease